MKLYFNEVSNTILDVKLNKRSEVFNFGSDNAYPSLVEALIEMSVTAKTCVDRVSKAIYGSAFGEAGKVIVNSEGETLNEVLRIAARQYAKQNNCYLHITYDANLDLKAINVIPVVDARIGKSDDRNYSGKFVVYNNWDKSVSKQIKPLDFSKYDKYNPDKDIIKGQIENSIPEKKEKQYKDAKVEDIIPFYNGQIWHIRKDKTYKYAISDLNPVLSDALLESNSQTFRSKGALKGFLNAKLLVVPPFKDDKEREEFRKELNDVRGADNSSETVMLETKQVSDDVSKQIHLDDLSGEYNDKLFEYSDEESEGNICKAFSVPLILVSQNDNAMFGNSGAMLQEAKIQLWESREEDRNQFEEVFGALMALFNKDKRISEGISIGNPFMDDDEIEEAKNINKEAQAKLRGSVGGVGQLIALMGAVNENQMTKESAIEIVKNIYGFTDKKAKAMVGGFEEDIIEDKK